MSSLETREVSGKSPPASRRATVGPMSEDRWRPAVLETIATIIETRELQGRAPEEIAVDVLEALGLEPLGFSPGVFYIAAADPQGLP